MSFFIEVFYIRNVRSVLITSECKAIQKELCDQTFFLAGRAHALAGSIASVHFTVRILSSQSATYANQEQRLNKQFQHKIAMYHNFSRANIIYLDLESREGKQKRHKTSATYYLTAK